MQNFAKTALGQKLFLFFVVLPLLLSPFFSVYFYRAMAFTPIIMTIAGGLIVYFLLKQKIIWPKNLLILIAVTLCGAALSTLSLPDTGEGMERVLKLALTLPFYALTYALIRGTSNYFPKKTYFYLLIAAAIGALLLSLDLLFGSSLFFFTRGIDEVPRVFSTAVYNNAANIIMLFGLVAFAKTGREKQSQRLIFFAAILGMLFVVQSQTTQFMLLIAALFYFAFPAHNKAAWAMLYALMVIGMFIKPFLAHYVYTHFAVTLNELIPAAYIGHRLEIWDFTGRYAMQSPFWGHGIEITRMVEAFDSGNIFKQDSSILHPHSFIMQLWIEFGVIGVAFGALCLGLLMRYLFTHYEGQDRRIAFMILMVVLFAACVTYGMWQGWWLGTLFLLFSILEVKTPNSLPPAQSQ